MNKFSQSILDAIGNTPIIKLQKVANKVESEIYVKLEYISPGGSIKDRVGKFIIDQAIKRGDLKSGGTIIEGTSGNTGVGLAIYAAVHGYKAIFVVPDKQSIEKINNLRAFGAKVIVTPTDVEPDDPRSYYSVSKRLAQTIPNSFYANQYFNLDNKRTHFEWTGPEIFEQTNGEFDIFIAGVGTGGTISGCSEYLKQKMPHLKTIGVDIEGSILTHYHRTREITQAHTYILEGIGEDIIPANVNFDIIDDFVVVNDKESFLMTRALLKQEGIYAGGSSGAAVAGALKYAATLDKPKRILVILPDSGNRYTSKIYNDTWMREHGYLEIGMDVSITEVLMTLDKFDKPYISINENATVGESIELMRKHDISQLPVYNSNYLSGIVTEHDLLKQLFEGIINPEDQLTVALNNQFEILNIRDYLDKAAESLLNKKIVIIEDNKQHIAILTDIDILNFMSKRNY